MLRAFNILLIFIVYDLFLCIGAYVKTTIICWKYYEPTLVANQGIMGVWAEIATKLSNTKSGSVAFLIFLAIVSWFLTSALWIKKKNKLKLNLILFICLCLVLCGMLSFFNAWNLEKKYQRPSALVYLFELWGNLNVKGFGNTVGTWLDKCIYKPLWTLGEFVYFSHTTDAVTRFDVGQCPCIVVGYGVRHITHQNNETQTSY